MEDVKGLVPGLVRAPGEKRPTIRPVFSTYTETVATLSDVPRSLDRDGTLVTSKTFIWKKAP